MIIDCFQFDKVICTLLSSNLARMDKEMTEVLLDHCINRESEEEKEEEEEEGESSPPPFIPSFLKDNNHRSNDVIRDPKLLVSGGDGCLSILCVFRYHWLHLRICGLEGRIRG